MKSRSIIIFSIFILVALIFAFFVFVYRSYVEQLVKDYVAKITTCGNILDEADCYAKDFCEGIYAPACEDCQELEFKQCQKVSDKLLAQLQTEKKLCEQTGGYWYRNKLGNFCLCDKVGINKIWNAKSGCVNK